MLNFKQKADKSLLSAFVFAPISNVFAAFSGSVWYCLIKFSKFNWILFGKLALVSWPFAPNNLFIWFDFKFSDFNNLLYNSLDRILPILTVPSASGSVIVALLIKSWIWSSILFSVTKISKDSFVLWYISYDIDVYSLSSYSVVCGSTCVATVNKYGILDAESLGRWSFADA